MQKEQVIGFLTEGNSKEDLAEMVIELMQQLGTYDQLVKEVQEIEGEEP